MQQTIKVVVRYDGTGFSGWQVQPRQRTVQGVIEEALARILRERVHIHGAGRTDAGVHAFGQVFSCRLPAEADLARILRSLTYMLTPEVRIESIERVDDSFHARKSALSKRYAYTFCFDRTVDPFTARTAWTPHGNVELSVLEAQARQLAGTHDFAGFQGGKASVKTTVRTIYAITLERGGSVQPIDGRDLWRLVFDGDGFLYRMVRNIVGTLVDIARGRIPAERIDALLASPGPYIGYTAPARGLTLIEVRYPED